MIRILSPKTNTPKHDMVYTPKLLAKEIIDHYNPRGLLLDPCKGGGAFYDQYPLNCSKDWCEIEEGRNFFSYEKKVDWIITNPPWSMIKLFLVHGMKVASHIVYLVTINHYTTSSRIREIRNANFGVKEIYMVNHPSEKCWPKSGFQLAAIHLEKNWKGKCELTFSPKMVGGNLEIL